MRCLLIFSLLLPIYLFSQEDDSLKIVELTKDLEIAKEDTSKVNILNELANEFIGLDNEKGLNYSNNALILAKKLNFSTGISKAYYNVGKCFYYEYEFDSIIHYYNISKEINKQKENLPTGASYELLMGLVYQIQSDYSLAIYHYKEALNLYTSLNDQEKSAYCHNNLGVAYGNLGDYQKALNNYFLSLEINEEIGNLSMVAKTLANIGGIYEDQEKFENALEYYKKAILIASNINSKQIIADTYRNIGGIYSQKEKFDSTLSVYNKSLELYKELNDIRGLVVLYNLFGQTYNAKDWNTFPDYLNIAYEYYKKSLEINNREISEIEEKIVSYQGIADVYTNKNKFNKAIPYLNKAISMAKEIESLDNVQKCHKALSQAYAGVGNFQLAYENYVLYKNWSDTLKSDENVELLTQMSMQYEFDKQQKEQEFYQAQKDLEYQQKQQRDRLIRAFIIAVLIIVSGFSVQVLRSYQRKKKDNILLAHQNEEIEKQKEEITDSIRYAKRIQTAILPSDDWANCHLPEHFILFRPRDIVSGDYYWMNKIDNKVILVAADCTGHGVPGAFMSMLGVSFLNEIVNKNNTVQPSLILNQLRDQVKRTLDQTGKEGEAKDGMDIAICVINFDTMLLEYAGAYNPLYLFRNGELLETKGDKMPIGIYIREKDSFTNHEIQLEKGDTFYIFSDGYADQFGGPNGGKFKSRPFKELLAKIQHNSMLEQWEILESTIDDWRGDIDQIDDMIILGVRV
ncbi:MAG: tetratricopeptide repeat protein [Salinivirgaceae bacterium]|jgi:serine phosphatase RsbU (regulator of sigma subunit)|nr:tetratricopeptide repeat protein [Salinivirgaceae bacterium]